MTEERDIHICYKVLEHYSTAELSITALVESAIEATQKSYAPYSKFHVGAAAKLDNSEIVSGANIENASFPAGICAERATLATVSSLGGSQVITDLAIAIKTERKSIGGVPAPCGICRQTLLEWENRQKKPITLWLLGPGNQLTCFKSVSDLMPFGFKAEQLGE